MRSFLFIFLLAATFFVGGSKAEAACAGTFLWSTGPVTIYGMCLSLDGVSYGYCDNAQVDAWYQQYYTQGYPGYADCYTPPPSCGAVTNYTEANPTAISNYCGACSAGQVEPSSISCHAGSGWTAFGASCTAPYCTGCGCTTPTPTGTWTAPTCSTACGTAASTPAYTCVGGNGSCSTNSPATKSCAATAACATSGPYSAAPACPTACGTTASTQYGACSYDSCTGTQPTRSCSATAACPTSGAWTAAPVCPTACGTGASTKYGTCNYDSCTGTQPTRSCSATAACTCAAPLTQNVTVACDTNSNGFAATSGSVTRSQTKSASPGCTFPSTPITVSNSTYVTDNCVYPPATCTTPWGSTINNGVWVYAFNAAQVTSPASCGGTNQEQRTCSNGTLSGSFTNANCTVLVPTITSFTVAPTRVRPGSGTDVVIKWSTTDVTSCSVKKSGSTQTIGSGTSSSPSGTTDTVTAETTYTITCDSNLSKSVTVNVVPGYGEF